jgi:hypothetical protein
VKRQPSTIIPGIEDRIILVPNKVVAAVFDDRGKLKQVDECWNSRTAAGAVAVSHALFDTAAQPGAFKYVALTTTGAFTPVVGDTVLSAEVTTGGCARQAHVYTAASAPGALNGTGATVSTTTWGSITLSFTLTGAGIFNAASVGTLGFESAFGASVAVQNGYSLVLTWTLNE